MTEPTLVTNPDYGKWLMTHDWRCSVFWKHGRECGHGAALSDAPSLKKELIA